MYARTKNRAIMYARRSSEKQENSLEMQVGWAEAKAKADGFMPKFNEDLLKRAQSDGVSVIDDLYIDDAVSGSDRQRPGLLAFMQRAFSDPSVSHLYIHKRDRLSRPENAAEATSDEFKLLREGITIVFCDTELRPSSDGQADIGQAIISMIEYHRSGRFLADLSRRVLDVQKKLAEQGFSTGGRAPYGFARFLKAPDGTLTKLEDGRIVRQAGHHVVQLPDDEEKIATWILILEMRERGIGYKNIANHLNSVGIPSPDSGRTRTDSGAKHFVSGQWNHNTVKSLCENSKIAGVLEYGTRSEGKHFRFDATSGSRVVLPTERDGDRVVTVVNPSESRVRVDAAFEPEFDRERFEAIQAIRDSRSRSQQGIPKNKNPEQYPLSTRVVDLTEGCGAPMYGSTQSNKKDGKPFKKNIYKCSRHAKTSDCYHNSVDGEALLRVVLRSLKHLIRLSGSRDQLARQLLKLARQRPTSETEESAAIRRLEMRAEALAIEQKEIGRKLAIEMDDSLQQVFREEFEDRKRQLLHVKQELSRTNPAAAKPGLSPEQRVEQALAMFDKLDVLASSPEARPRINQVLQQLNVWIGLDFHAAKWGKRTVRRVRSGVISIGGYHLPVPLHGSLHCPAEPTNPVGGRSIGTDSAFTETPSNPSDGGKNVGEIKAYLDEVGGSLTKVNRGDTIRTCDLLVPNQTLCQAELRPDKAVFGRPWNACGRRSRPRRREISERFRFSKVHLGVPGHRIFSAAEISHPHSVLLLLRDGFAGPELSEYLQNSVQMGHSGTKPIDEFVQHVFTFDQVIARVVDLFGQRLQKLGLHFAERFGGAATGARQLRVGVFPLLQFTRTLLVHRGILLNQFGQQFGLLLLADDQLTQQPNRQFLVRNWHASI